MLDRDIHKKFFAVFRLRVSMEDNIQSIVLETFDERKAIFEIKITYFRLIKLKLVVKAHPSSIQRKL